MPRLRAYPVVALGRLSSAVSDEARKGNREARQMQNWQLTVQLRMPQLRLQSGGQT